MDKLAFRGEIVSMVYRCQQVATASNNLPGKEPVYAGASRWRLRAITSQTASNNLAACESIVQYAGASR